MCNTKIEWLHCKLVKCWGVSFKLYRDIPSMSKVKRGHLWLEKLLWSILPIERSHSKQFLGCLRQSALCLTEGKHLIIIGWLFGNIWPLWVFCSLCFCWWVNVYRCFSEVLRSWGNSVPSGGYGCRYLWTFLICFHIRFGSHHEQILYFHL